MNTPRTDRLLRASRCLLILTAVLVGLCLPTLTPGGGERVTGATPQALTFEQRVLRQRHIEEVYWRHRIWPKENPGPKPSLDAVLEHTAVWTGKEMILLLGTRQERVRGKLGHRLGRATPRARRVRRNGVRLHTPRWGTRECRDVT